MLDDGFVLATPQEGNLVITRLDLASHFGELSFGLQCLLCLGNVGSEPSVSLIQTPDSLPRPDLLLKHLIKLRRSASRCVGHDENASDCERS